MFYGTVWYFFLQNPPPRPVWPSFVAVNQAALEKWEQEHPDQVGQWVCIHRGQWVGTFASFDLARAAADATSDECHAGVEQLGFRHTQMPRGWVL